MMLSDASYAAEEYGKVADLPAFAHVDCVQLLGNDNGCQCNVLPVGVCRPESGALYTVVPAGEAEVELDGLCLRRVRCGGDELARIMEQAARCELEVYWERCHGGHEEGWIAGGEPRRYALDERIVIVEDGAFKGVFLNWIGAARGSWWNGINQCVLMADGTTLGVTAATYGFDYDDSAYYGADAWRVALR